MFSWTRAMAVKVCAMSISGKIRQSRRRRRLVPIASILAPQRYGAMRDSVHHRSIVLHQQTIRLVSAVFHGVGHPSINVPTRLSSAVAVPGPNDSSRSLPRLQDLRPPPVCFRPCSPCTAAKASAQLLPPLIGSIWGISGRRGGIGGKSPKSRQPKIQVCACICVLDRGGRGTSSEQRKRWRQSVRRR